MSISRVTWPGRVEALARLDPKVVLAFAAIYLLWGATFLAIRVTVLEVPPLFAGGLRFLIAGAVLYAIARLRGRPSPVPREWRTLAVVSLCMFVATYAALFWAAQFVPSGITSVIEATLPLTTVVLEVAVFRQQPFRWRTAAAVVLGFLGVAILLLTGDRAPVPVLPCLAILGAGVAWSLGAVLTRTMPRPQSAALTAGAQMMLGGAALLLLSVASGELASPPHIPARAALAILYLIVAGSLVAYTAYIWLLARMPATQVASHAYVNPLVAVALGYFIAGEPLTPRMLLAAALVVGGVFLILSPSPPRRAEPATQPRRATTCQSSENGAPRFAARSGTSTSAT